MQGQTNNFLSWAIQPQNIPNIAISQRRLDQSMVF